MTPKILLIVTKRNSLYNLNTLVLKIHIATKLKKTLMRIKLKLLQILNSNKTPKIHCAQTQIMTIQIVTSSNIKKTQKQKSQQNKKKLWSYNSIQIVTNSKTQFWQLKCSNCEKTWKLKQNSYLNSDNSKTNIFTTQFLTKLVKSFVKNNLTA